MGEQGGRGQGEKGLHHRVTETQSLKQNFLRRRIQNKTSFIILKTLCLCDSVVKNLYIYLDYSKAARYRSQSRAAAQPDPAAVIA